MPGSTSTPTAPGHTPCTATTTRTVTRFARRRSFSVAKWYTWNFDRELQGNGVHVFGNVQLRNYWTLFGGGFGSLEIQDDRATRGGAARGAARLRRRLLRLRERRPQARGALGESEIFGGADGGSVIDLGLQVRYRPAASLELSAGPRVRRNRLPAQYVGTFEDPVAAPTYGSRYVFAWLDQRELSIVTRASVVFSPKASLQVYMQPLVSVGDYTRFKQLARPRTYDFITVWRGRGHPQLRCRDAAVHGRARGRRRAVRLRRPRLQRQVAAPERDLPLGMATGLRDVLRLDRTARRRLAAGQSSRSGRTSGACSRHRPTT
jgi:hypothetical protein